MLRRIDIISIPVSDQAAAKQFYMDMLGFEIVHESPMGPDRTWIQLRPPGGETSVTLVTWFDSMPPGSIKGLVLISDDVEATHAELAGKGLEIDELRKAPWGKFTTFSDPDGNGWVLQQAS